MNRSGRSGVPQRGHRFCVSRKSARPCCCLAMKHRSRSGAPLRTRGPERPPPRSCRVHPARHGGHHGAPAGPGRPTAPSRVARRDAGEYRGCGHYHGHSREDHLPQFGCCDFNRLAGRRGLRAPDSGGGPPPPRADAPAAGRSRHPRTGGRPGGQPGKSHHPAPATTAGRWRSRTPARPSGIRPGHCTGWCWSFATCRPSSDGRMSSSGCGRLNPWGCWRAGLPTILIICSPASWATFPWRNAAGWDRTARVAARLTQAEHACQRATALTQQLLTFARGGAPIRHPVALHDVLHESVTFALHGTTVRSDMALPATLWPVDGDEGQLSQVLHNIVLNAVQAMPQGGGGGCGTWQKVASRPASSPCPRGRARSQIMVRDHGGGIPGAVLPRTS